MFKRFFLLLFFLNFSVLSLIYSEVKTKTYNLNKKQEAPKSSSLKNNEKDIYMGLRSFAETISTIEQKAFRTPNFDTIIENGLKNLVASVDAHSAFFTEESYRTTIESTSGEFSGIGISTIGKSPEDDALVVVEVIPGGPAEKAGLKCNDKIVDVNGEKLRGLSADEVISKLKGKAGTFAKIKVIRDKKPLDFKIKREIIKDQTSLCYLYKNQDIYYLSLKIFAETAAKQVKDILKKANAGKCNGLVLDLRRNPGGILDSAVDMASLFLNQNSLVVTTKDRQGKTVAKYETKTNPVLKSEIPIFVLIDNFTASASEILAGCLKYYSEKNFTEKSKSKLVVFLLGTSTFGKGSVQEVIPMSNGCALKLTTMLYYLPNDTSIQAIGINPDFTIKPKITPVDEIKWINELYGKENSLKNYITIKEVEKNNNKKSEVKEQKSSKDNDEEKEKSWEEKQREAILQDNQIQAAINMITLYNLAKKCNPENLNSREKAIKFLKSNYLTDDNVNLVKVK